MAQIIKHRRGSIANVGTLSPVNTGEIILGTGSIGNLVGPVLFVGDSGSYKAVPQLYYGSSAPDISSYGQLEGVSFYNSTDKSLYILKAAGNTRLDLAGAISGSTVNPYEITVTTFTASYSNVDYSIIDNNLTIGVSGSLQVIGTVSSSLVPSHNNSFDLGTSGSRWNYIWGNSANFYTASGYFTGSFVGDGSGLTGLVTELDIISDSGSGSVDLLTQALSIVGTANEIETSISGQTLTIGLPNNVTIGGDLTVGGNDIKSSTGATAITLSGSNVEFANNVTVTGNLTVNGTSTIVNSTTVQIGDNIIELNGTGAANAGLVVKDPTSPNTVSGSLLWDSTNDYWVAGPLGSEKRIAVQNASTLTTNALIFGNASSQIVSMTAPSGSGEIAQWNGSAWTMSNVIDGGTF